MQDFNGTKIIGIDHGYGNIKTANTVTPTGVIVSSDKPTFDVNALFYAATLMAVARELSLERITEVNVHIAAGLPVTWVSSQRESFRKYLMKNENVIFTYNKKTYAVHFTSCSIHPQGYAAVIGNLKDMNGVNMLADIGNGTINIMYITNHRPADSKCFNEKMGAHQCMIAAQHAVMTKFGAKIDSSIIESFFKYGSADVSERYGEIITNEIKVYTEKVLEILEKYEYNSELMRLYIAGGGARIMKNFAEFDKPRVIFIEDICAAAKGYETIAAQLLRRRAS